MEACRQFQLDRISNLACLSLVFWMVAFPIVANAQQSGPAVNSQVETENSGQIENGKSAESDSQLDFLKHVQPILDLHCVKCHGVDKQMADLRLDLRATILQGSGSGPIVHIGKSSSSRLIEVVSGDDPDCIMPPEGERLSPNEIDTLKQWIDQGARGTDDSAKLKREVPWSFKPVVRPESPSGTAAIDYWLGQKLQASGLSHSPTSDRHNLIRRLFLVVLGVPPSQSEVQQFIDDTSDQAYEKLVDRVLADPRYGERMARHWFDVVRFAESHGFETNRVRYNAWPYRDYVIRAFNEDKPYDRFVAEQIVGDTLQADAATGYLVAGTYDLVKSPDINLTLMQRQDELADLINTTGTTFLGLTLGCARCHDHKFDPVTQKDFYALQAVFAGVKFGERKILQQLSSEQREEIARLENEIRSAEQILQRLRDKSKQIPEDSKQAALLPKVNSKLNVETFEPIVAKAVRFSITHSGNSQPCIDELEVFNDQGENVALASQGGRASASSTLPGYAIHKLEHLNDGRFGNQFSWISNEINSGVVRIEFAKTQTIVRMTWGRDRDEKFRDRLATGYIIEVLGNNDVWTTVGGSDRRQSTGDKNDSEDQRLVARLPDRDQQEFRRYAIQLKTDRSRLEDLTRGTAAWIGTFSQPETVYRLYRGDPLIKREVVEPAMVTALGGSPLAGELTEQQRRVELAKWLTSRENPLTARVMVNRIWHNTFGTGIVDTPSDFGGNGTKPSHPELLDWLADEFVSSGWSVKQIHRMILLSAAFRQSSRPSSQGLAVDADSRLLWRFPPRRLEAEAIRDSMLVVSDVMNWQMGGPGFFLQRVEEDNVYRYFPKEEVGANEYRRMVYLTRVRGEQDAVFGSFDCPSGNQVVPKRSRSNTPLQSLNLYNSLFVQQQAELLAARLERQAGNQPSQQAQLAFQVLLIRSPDEFEAKLSEQTISQLGLVAFCRAMLNTTEFLFIF